MVADAGAGLVAFAPDDRLTGEDGRTFLLPLRHARLAATLDGGEEERALFARFGARPVMLAAQGCSLRLGDGPEAPPFELVTVRDTVERLHCEPALLSVSAAMRDAVAGPLLPPRGTSVAFAGPSWATRGADGDAQAPPRVRVQATPTPRPTSQPPRVAVPVTRQPVKQTEEPTEAPTEMPRVQVRPQERATVQIQPGAIGRVTLPTNLRIPVLRPEDLLALEFELVNLRLETEGGARLVRSGGSGQALLIVHFPPQNISEEAFYEKTTGNQQFKEPDATSPSTALSSDELKAPPVEARISGPSRLVFQVPGDVVEIPYTLEALLEACRSYPLKVPATALPPDPPPPKFAVPPMRELRGRKKNAALATAIGTATVAQTAPSTRPVARAASPADQPPPSARPMPRAAVAPTAKPGPSEQKVPRQAIGVSQATPQAIRPELHIEPMAILGPPEPPTAQETAIEAPYRLFLSPHRAAAWAHATAPVAGPSGRFELWHTRLGVRDDDGSVDEGDDHYRTLRAVWSPDYNVADVPEHYPNDPELNPYRASLDARDRHEIVPLTSDWTIPGYKPLPVKARRFMLTSLGVWMDTRGAWEPPVDPKASESSTTRSTRRSTIAGPPGLQLEVEEWRHRATMGRDHYERVVYKGYLFPFRHRASLIKVTERKLAPVPDGPLRGSLAAYLFQRMFIVVREPEVIYDYSGLGAEGARLSRRNPFRTVRITTLVTPNLDRPEDSDLPEPTGDGQQAFWPRVGGQDFLFHLIAEDWRGERSEFTAPLIFLGAENASNASKETFLGGIVEAYESSGGRASRVWDGQSVAFAEEATPGDTVLETDRVIFGAAVKGPSQPTGVPRYFPTVREAVVRIPAVEAVTGGEPSSVAISPAYVEYGFDGNRNKSELFVQLLEASPLRFPADRSGGLVTPNLNIAALSRRSGPVGGAPAADAGDAGDAADPLENFASGGFDPASFFGGAAAKILGGVDLFEILLGGSSDDAPKLTNTFIYPGGDESKPPEAVRTDLLWNPRLDNKNPILHVNSGGTLSIEAHLITRFTGGDPEYSIKGTLTKFSINLLSYDDYFIQVEFSRLEFSAGSGSKMSLVPQISDVHFGNALKFIEELRSFLKEAGVNIDISGGAITVGYSIAIPAVTVGVMNLQNISLGAGLTIPLNGDPVRLRFNFCERENPFLLTVYCFGGGGFVGLEVSTRGVELLEIALEFGASASLDIGVASGGVEVMAGIYIRMENNLVSLTGYMRMGGELEILAIISLSIEFYLGFEYDEAENKVWGEARLTVEVSVLFFSASVELKVRREIADPDVPKFADMISAGEWDAYCQAFA